MADVKLPGVGPVSKKWVIIVLAGSAATVGYVVLRKRSQAAAASTSTDTSATDGSDIDPLTGDVAGSAQDQADLAAMQAGGYGDLGLDGLGSSLGNYGGYLAATPAAASIPGAGGFTTNGEWAQQAETDLGGLGISQTTLSAALGAYLTGRPLTAAQQGLVDQAIAEEGYPPVSGPGGYPPAMKTSATGSSGGGTTGTTSTKVTVPKTFGERADTAISKVQAAGFKVKTSPARSSQHEYVSTGSSPEGGTQAAKGSTVTIHVKISK